MFQALAILEAPAVEPASPELVRQHVRVDHTGDDNLLAVYAAASRSLAENYLGRALAPQRLRYSLSEQPFGSRPHLVGAPVILPQWLPHALSGNRAIRLPRSPVRSVERVAVSRSGEPDDLVLTAAGYSSDLSASPGRVQLASPVPHGQHVTIDFTAGPDPADRLPPVLLQAILFGTAWLYEHRGDGDATLPDAFYHLLTPYRLVTFG